MNFKNIKLISRRLNKMNCRINLTWFLAMIVIVAGISNAQPGMIYERWDTAGTPDIMLTETSTPDYSEIVSIAQWGVVDDPDPSDYRARLTGYIVPPVTGNYRFWVITDDNSRLWLSTNTTPANAVEIARETGWRDPDDWGNIGDEQVSDLIPLVGGNIYWIRGGYEEGGGGDHIQIAWASTEAGIANPTLIGVPDVFVTLPNKAYNPSPADGEFFQYSTDATELQWTLPPSLLDPNGTGPGVSCDVLFFTEDPAINPGATSDLLVDHLDGPVESVALNGLADTQAHYWWRVDIYDPNGDNFVITEGDVWTFSSARDVAMVFIDETEGSTSISEVDPAQTDEYVISLSMDPGAGVEVVVTITEVADNDPLTNTYEEMEGGVGSDSAKLTIGYDGTGSVVELIAVEEDDVEQDISSGEMDLGSSDLEIFNDGSSIQIIGLRFTTVNIPQGATIDSAIVEFQVDQPAASGEIYGIISAENVDDADPIADVVYELTDRQAANSTTATSAFTWTDDYVVTDIVATGDFSSVIQEIVNRPGWTPGNDILIFLYPDPNPDPADIEFVGGSTTYVLDSSNWDTGVTVTIKAVDDDDLEVYPDMITLTSTSSSTDSAWTGLPVSDVVVAIDEDECGAWGFQTYDFNTDCYVDLGDLNLIALEWLTCSTPNTGTCVDPR